jgi:hypothetical protein
MQSIVELNDQISFYLIVILVFISWMLSSIALQFSKNKLVYKYENHGSKSLLIKEQFLKRLFKQSLFTLQIRSHSYGVIKKIMIYNLLNLIPI